MAADVLLVMKIRIWRTVPRIWCWHCPLCGKTWRNRQAVAFVRPQRTGKYWPFWAVEVKVPSAWERCVSAAYSHIRRYHGDMLL